MGEHTQRVKRYRLSELLDPEFRLPRPQDDFAAIQDVEGIVYDEV